jgi:superkiller protein 3
MMSGLQHNAPSLLLAAKVGRLGERKIALVVIVWILMPVACSALAQTPRSPVDTAWDLLARGQRSEAVELLYRIIRGNPANASARLLLGSILMEEGQREPSIAQLSEAVRLKPDSPEAQNALGEAYKAFGNPQTARGCFEKAISLNPDFAVAQVNLGFVLIESGEFSDAVPHLKRAIQLMGQSPDAAYPHYLLAKVFTAQGRVPGAAAELQRAVALQPDFAEAWSDLGEARETLLDDTGALAAFENAVRLAPNDPVAQTRLGTEMLNQKKAAEAIPHLEKAVRLNPRSQSALYGLERALREDGQIEQSEAVKRELAEVLRERDRAAQNLFAAIQLNDQGAALERDGKLREALEKYEEALKLDPEHVGIRVNVAAALLRLGRRDEGVAELREALRRDPDNLAVKKALEDALVHPVR